MLLIIIPLILIIAFIWLIVKLKVLWWLFPDRHCPHAVVVYCHINLEAAALRRLLLN